MDKVLFQIIMILLHLRVDHPLKLCLPDNVPRVNMIILHSVLASTRDKVTPVGPNIIIKSLKIKVNVVIVPSDIILTLDQLLDQLVCFWEVQQ